MKHSKNLNHEQQLKILKIQFNKLLKEVVEVDKTIKKFNLKNSKSNFSFNSFIFGLILGVAICILFSNFNIKL